MSDLTNDNEGPRPVWCVDAPDSHGQAALLLVESLIHALVARSVVSIEDAIDLVNVAIDVKEEMTADRGDSKDEPDTSLSLLSAIRESLGINNS